MPSEPELSVAGFYDGIYVFYGRANSLLTLGLDRWWRARAARLAGEAAPGASSALDVCCGTGDFSLSLKTEFGPRLDLSGADLSGAMLSVAEKRLPGVKLVKAEAKSLPFPDDSFDLLTISFATRNLRLGGESLPAALREFRRVLKPGGTFLNLETTRPGSPPVRAAMHAYVRAMIALLGLFTPGNRPAYRFLRDTILSFYSAEEFSGLLAEAGFSAINARSLFPGAVAVHTAKK